MLDSPEHLGEIPNRMLRPGLVRPGSISLFLNSSPSSQVSP